MGCQTEGDRGAEEETTQRHRERNNTQILEVDFLCLSHCIQTVFYYFLPHPLTLILS